jgi:MFS family permease
MMGGVNTAYDFYTLMGFGHKGPDGGVVVDDDLLQGGIVSIYYLGTLMGCLAGGSIGDRFGRIKTIFAGAAVAVVGAALQCSAMNKEWMICARLINGWGTGILNAIIPVWATETAEHKSRGQFIAIEFTLNILGVVIAYWLEYGCSFYGDGTSSFIWRFPIAFQIPMLFGLMGLVLFFPESPRWLVKMGREDEARYILGRLRGQGTPEEQEATEVEFQDIVASCELERSNFRNQSYFHMLFGIGSGKMHTGRRVQLVAWLQIMQEWVGIGTFTTHPVPSEAIY